ncbi:glycosyltransferase family 2 protein [Pseudomonas sp. GV071]|uniref:glycosyltransferase family 2 protein n=1 Tax=Pseudomonas sp. GV071 TaxID=2135754 RepID=UPI0011B206DF|nr:glycosyltransferase family 2 protein [Pseudomonas sp. GV071]
MDAHIVAVVVTFYPDEAAVTELVRYFSSAVTRVVVVDNTPLQANVDVAALFKDFSSVEVHALHDNKGIATALNVGINIARAQGADYVLLSDQDSCPAEDMVPQLFAALKQLRLCAENKVAAVGPVYVDGRDGSVSPFARVGGFRYRFAAPSSAEPIIKVSALISSGSLIPLSVLDAVGDMREELFIDLVDTEWCLRAGVAGYGCYGAYHARMVHPVGDELMRIGFFKKIDVPMHSPLRLYYQFRNAFYLYKDLSIPLAWKINDLVYRFGLFRAYLFFAPHKAKYLWSFASGFCNGLIGKMGRKGQ